MRFLVRQLAAEPLAEIDPDDFVILLRSGRSCA